MTRNKKSVVDTNDSILDVSSEQREVSCVVSTESNFLDNEPAKTAKEEDAKSILCIPQNRVIPIFLSITDLVVSFSCCCCCCCLLRMSSYCR